MHTPDIEESGDERGAPGSVDVHLTNGALSLG